jgi:trk/ktr system potassium uptake protein
MRHLIVGCGRLGAILATTLAEEGHAVTIIDRDPAAFARLGATFRGERVVGVAFDQHVIETAHIAESDSFATVTNGDNTNFVLAAMARWRYHVPRVVARVYDPVKAEIYGRLGIPTVSPTNWGAARIKELLCYGAVTPLLDIGNGDVEIVEVEVGPLVAGRTVGDLCTPDAIQVVSVVRAGRAFIPTSSSPLQAHDVIQVAISASARGRLEEILGVH